MVAADSEFSIPEIDPHIFIEDKLKLHRPVNGEFFHYTDANGLMGIVQNKCLWATNIHFFNDSSEFKKLFGIIKKRLNSSDQFSKIILEFIKSIENLAVYVCSFSESKDQLSQWRGYCGNGGYMLSYDFDLIQKLCREEGIRVTPCIYKKDQHEKVVDRLINYYQDIYNNSDKTSNDNWQEVFRRSFWQTASYIAPLIKDSAFAEEKEWRLIAGQAGKGIEFRVSKSLVVPYREISFKSKDYNRIIKSITAGPMNHQELALHSLASLQFQSGLNYTIDKSKLPYRTN